MHIPSAPAFRRGAVVDPLFLPCYSFPARNERNAAVVQW